MEVPLQLYLTLLTIIKHVNPTFLLHDYVQNIRSKNQYCLGNSSLLQPLSAPSAFSLTLIHQPNWLENVTLKTFVLYPSVQVLSFGWFDYSLKLLSTTIVNELN